MSAVRADHADVRFPPPLLYAGVVLAGTLAQRRWPLVLADGGSGGMRRIAGGVLVAGCAGLTLGAFRRFREAGTSPVPVRPSTALVPDGPYRFTRNPMYLGLTLGTAGVGLLAGNPWVLLLLVPAVAVADLAFVRPEERYLERTFGAAYQSYRMRVRRWL